MIEKVYRSFSDYNTVAWQKDHIAMERESDTHVRITRHTPRLSRPLWAISLDATSGHQQLHVIEGNRLACVANQYILAITCGRHISDNSAHNYHIHRISEDGQVVWSLPWQTIERFAIVDDKLLIIRYVSPPQFWIQATPIEAHLIDLETGDSLHEQGVTIPESLLPHFQSYNVRELRTYLVWKDGQLIVTVRPYFRHSYTPAKELINRGSFKATLQF